MTREEFLKQWPRLAEDYKASTEVLKRIGNVTLCMVVGPSGVGKSSLIEHSGFTFVPSDTTRDIRPGEHEGVDMYFRKDYDQVIADIKSGRFVQIAPFATGDFYGTKDTSYPDSGVAIMPVIADAIPGFRNLGFQKTITAFITPPSHEEWMRRLQSHPIPPEKVAQRMAEAKSSLNFALTDAETHFVLNEQLEKAAAQIRSLVRGQFDKAAEELARLAAKEMLGSIK